VLKSWDALHTGSNWQATDALGNSWGEVNGEATMVREAEGTYTELPSGDLRKAPAPPSARRFVDRAGMVPLSGIGSARSTGKACGGAHQAGMLASLL
jgi:hypothetical protein